MARLRPLCFKEINNLFSQLKLVICETNPLTAIWQSITSCNSLFSCSKDNDHPISGLCIQPCIIFLEAAHYQHDVQCCGYI